MAVNIRLPQYVKLLGFLACLNKSLGTAIIVTMALMSNSASRLWLFEMAYFLNPWMGSFDTCTVVRYWSKVEQSIILILGSDLDVKVMDLEKEGHSDCFFFFFF